MNNLTRTFVDINHAKSMRLGTERFYRLQAAIRKREESSDDRDDPSIPAQSTPEDRQDFVHL